MADVATKVPLATTTIGTATNTVAFVSISGSYTDLVLVINSVSTSNQGFIQIRYNSDAGSNYSVTGIYGNGTSVQGETGSNQTYGYLNYNVSPGQTLTSNNIVNIQNYSNSTTYKTWLVRDNNTSTAGGSSAAYVGVELLVGLWRSTDAITRIDLYDPYGNFSSGSTFTLYGIL